MKQLIGDNLSEIAMHLSVQLSQEMFRSLGGDHRRLMPPIKYVRRVGNGFTCHLVYTLHSRVYTHGWNYKIT